MQELAYEQEILSYTATKTQTSTPPPTPAVDASATTQSFPLITIIPHTAPTFFLPVPPIIRYEWRMICYEIIGCIPVLSERPTSKVYTLTPTSTATFTSTPTATSTPTPTATSTHTPTVTYTFLPTFTATPAPIAPPRVVASVSAFIIILCFALLIGIIIRIVRRASH